MLRRMWVQPIKIKLWDKSGKVAVTHRKATLKINLNNKGKKEREKKKEATWGTREEKRGRSDRNIDEKWRGHKRRKKTEC